LAAQHGECEAVVAKRSLNPLLIVSREAREGGERNDSRWKLMQPIQGWKNII
jgi:hypothetical protein